MGPTWFLAMLLVFSLVYALFRVVAGTGTEKPTAGLPGVVSIVLFVVALVGIEYLWRMQVSVGESRRGFPSLAYLPQYLAFFCLGILAARRD